MTIHKPQLPPRTRRASAPMVLTGEEAQFLCRNTLKKEAEDWISASLSVKGLEREIDLSELRRNSKFWEGVATRGNDIEQSLWNKWQSNISFDTDFSTAASGLAANRATSLRSPGENISKFKVKFQERLHHDDEEAYQRIIKTDDTAIIIKTDDKAISHVNISHFRVPNVPPPPSSRLLLPLRPLPPVPASSPLPHSSALLPPDLPAALRPLPPPPPSSSPPPPPPFLCVPSTRKHALSNIDTDSVRHLLATTNHAILSSYSINAIPNVFASQTSGISPRKTAPGTSLVTLGGTPPVDPQGPPSPTDVGPVFYIDDRGYAMIVM